MTNIYQKITRPILAGEIYEAAVKGRWVSILTWGSATDLLIELGNGTFYPIKGGMSIKLPDSDDPFTLIRFQNTTALTVTLEFAVSDGEILDQRLSVSGIVQVSNAFLVPAVAVNGWGLQAVSNVAPGTKVISSWASRREYMIVNLSGNAGNMYIGFDNTLTNAKYAIMLKPGEGYIDDKYSGDVYVLSTVLNENVSFREV